MLSRLIGRESKAARARVASVTFYQHTRRFWFLFVTETARFRAVLKGRNRGRAPTIESGSNGEVKQKTYHIYPVPKWQG